MSDEIKNITLSSKTIPKDSYLSEYFELYQDPISQSIKNISKRIAVHKDNVILNELKKYGFTHENLSENLYRVEVFSADYNSKHFFVDGYYAFTLVDELVISDDFEAKNWTQVMAAFVTKLRIESSMIGMRCR